MIARLPAASARPQALKDRVVSEADYSCLAVIKDLLGIQK
jgi:hypothetical protein